MGSGIGKQKTSDIKVEQNQSENKKEIVNVKSKPTTTDQPAVTTAFSPTEFRSFKISKIIVLSPNTKQFTVDLYSINDETVFHVLFDNDFQY